MKNFIFFYSLLLSTITYSQAQENPSFLVSGNHQSCKSSFFEQQKEAVKNMQVLAEIKCGKSAALQTTETEIMETHSCPHYVYGARARAQFKCSTLISDSDLF